VASETLDVRNRIANRYKEGLIDNAAVIISALAVLIAALGLMFGGVAMYVAFDANEEAKIAGIRATNAEAKLEAYVRKEE